MHPIKDYQEFKQRVADICTKYIVASDDNSLGIEHNIPADKIEDFHKDILATTRAFVIGLAMQSTTDEFINQLLLIIQDSSLEAGNPNKIDTSIKDVFVNLLKARQAEIVKLGTKKKPKKRADEDIWALGEFPFPEDARKRRKKRKTKAHRNKRFEAILREAYRRRHGEYTPDGDYLD
jgi:hypothetical protein